MCLRKTGHFNFCVNYSKVNAGTIRDSYTIPCMEDCIYSHGKATIFSTLGTSSESSKVGVAEEDNDKNATSSLYKYYDSQECHLVYQTQLKRSNARWISNYPPLNGRLCLNISMISSFFLSSRTRTFTTFYHFWCCWPTLVAVRLKKCEIFTYQIDSLGNIIITQHLLITSCRIDTTLQVAKTYYHYWTRLFLLFL